MARGKDATDMPTIVNIGQELFKRTPAVRGETMNHEGGGYINDFCARVFCRFVNVQQTVAELAKSAVEFPPMQAPVSFNLSAIKAKIGEAINQQHGQ